MYSAGDKASRSRRAVLRYILSKLNLKTSALFPSPTCVSVIAKTFALDVRCNKKILQKIKDEKIWSKDKHNLI